MAQSITNRTSVKPLWIVLWTLSLLLMLLCYVGIVKYGLDVFWDELIYTLTFIAMSIQILSTIYFDGQPPYLPEPDDILLDHTYLPPEWTNFDWKEMATIQLPPIPIKKSVVKPKVQPAPNLKGYVYLVSIETGLYKIGLTTTVEGRMSGLSTGLPYELTLIHTIKCRDRFKIEKFFHDKFANKRVKGEWFNLDPEDVEYFKIFTEA